MLLPLLILFLAMTEVVGKSPVIVLIDRLVCCSCTDSLGVQSCRILLLIYLLALYEISLFMSSCNRRFGTYFEVGFSQLHPIAAFLSVQFVGGAHFDGLFLVSLSDVWKVSSNLLNLIADRKTYISARGSAHYLHPIKRQSHMTRPCVKIISIEDPDLLSINQMPIKMSCAHHMISSRSNNPSRCKLKLLIDFA